MASFNFPKISLDPSKIKNRWGLAALCLIVWLIISYTILSQPDLKIEITIVVLTLTLILLLLVLMLSIKPEIQSLSKPPPNTPYGIPSANQLPTQEITPEIIAYVVELKEMVENPAVQQVIQKKFGKRK
jgi:hypothetical protein